MRPSLSPSAISSPRRASVIVVVPWATAPACPTFATVERWVGRKLGGVQHERQVAAIATRLFDLTRPLHQLGPADRRLLRLAALVHDVGRCKSRSGHAKRGARMLLSSGALPLTAAERRALAYLTRHHRGRVPAAGRDSVLAPGDDHDRLLHVLAMLRAADALHNRSLEAGELTLTLLARASRSARRELRVTCRLPAPCAKARRVYARRKKFRLLEDLLDVRLDVRVEDAVVVKRVA